MVELFSMQSARRIGVAWNGRPTGPGVGLGSCVNEITWWTSSKCLQLDIEVSYNNIQLTLCPRNQTSEKDQVQIHLLRILR